jgi:hypothetical protein
MMLIAMIEILAVATAAGDSVAPLRTADEVMALMVSRDRDRQANLRGYTAVRRYVLENQAHHKRAEMLVRMTCREDGSKEFTVVSESGWGGARKFVFPRLLEGEIEAARPDVREQSRITPGNYRFELVGTESIRGRAAYVLEIVPRTSNKFLTRGRIWVDAADCAIVRVEGSPAKNPSFWIKSVHFIHDYEKTGSFWFPAKDRSVTDARFFGATELTIEYFDYIPNTLRPSISVSPCLTGTRPTEQED